MLYLWINADLYVCIPRLVQFPPPRDLYFGVLNIVTHCDSHKKHTLKDILKVKELSEDKKGSLHRNHFK